MIRALVIFGVLAVGTIGVLAWMAWPQSPVQQAAASTSPAAAFVVPNPAPTPTMMISAEGFPPRTQALPASVKVEYDRFRNTSSIEHKDTFGRYDFTLIHTVSGNSDHATDSPKSIQMFFRAEGDPPLSHAAEVILIVDGDRMTVPVHRTGSMSWYEPTVKQLLKIAYAKKVEGRRWDEAPFELSASNKQGILNFLSRMH